MGGLRFLIFFTLFFFIFYFSSETKQHSKTKFGVRKKLKPKFAEIHWGVLGELHFTTFIISGLAI